MFEITLIVQLATTDAMSQVHTYKRGNYFTMADCERDRDDILSRLSLKKAGGVLMIWCKPPGVEAKN